VLGARGQVQERARRRIEREALLEFGARTAQSLALKSFELSSYSFCAGWCGPARTQVAESSRAGKLTREARIWDLALGGRLSLVPAANR
jgi:hypothetical protein